MAIINLRDYYPFYTSDCFMEVSEEVAEMFKEFDRKEAAYRLRTYRHKAYYSLDRDDGLEHEAVFVALSPHELYERKVTMQELHAAISSLPDKQAKRIYAHFILGMTKQDIARAEGVHEKELLSQQFQNLRVLNSQPPALVKHTKGDLHSIEQISERMLSTPTESSVEFMVAELDDALQSLMFRWNICYERYSSFRLSDNEKKKISLIIQSGIDFLQKKKEVPL